MGKKLKIIFSVSTTLVILWTFTYYLVFASDRIIPLKPVTSKTRDASQAASTNQQPAPVTHSTTDATVPEVILEQNGTSTHSAVEVSVKDPVIIDASDNKKQDGNRGTAADKGRVVYLTIDDGPTIETTGRMLDILKEHDIKATFFVIGNQIKGKEDLIKRMHDEGHAIGLHSYSHDLKKVYSSQEAFIKEMQRTSDEIKRVLEIEPLILRFPGGSNKRLNKEFLIRLHKENYKVYDWTISSGDGMYPNNPPKAIFENAVESRGLSPSTILLMHSKTNNINSCEALPDIIEFYKKWGYSFEIVTPETPEYYFNFK